MDSQFIFLLVVGVIYFLNWLVRESGFFNKKDGPTPTGSRPAPQKRDLGEDEMMRKVREALGLPDEDPAPARRFQPQETQRPPVLIQPARKPTPPPVPASRQRQPVATPPPVQIPSLPVQVAVEAESHRGSGSELLAQDLAHAARLNRETESAYDVPKQDHGSAWHRKAGNAKNEPQRGKGNRWARELRSASNLRKAVIMREILGPPGGLQSSGNRS